MTYSPHSIHLNTRFATSMMVLVLLAGSTPAQEPAETVKMKISPEMLFESMAGRWEGPCRTWFQPGKLADESTVKGEFKPMLGGKFLRHTYQGEMRGKPRSGEETIVFNAAKNKFQSSWFDDFHMNYGLLQSEGDLTPSGFQVSGLYAVGGDHPAWGWKTVFELEDTNHLTITAYNITPDGAEAKAVETKYVRIND